MQRSSSNCRLLTGLRAALGNPGWGYDEVLPLFKRAEHNEQFADAFHGQGGPLNVTYPRFESPLSRMFLDACAQIERIESSVYRWQGALQATPEWRVVFKTTEAHYAALEAALLDAHPYEVPAVVAVPTHTVSVAFAEWVKGELA